MAALALLVALYANEGQPGPGRGAESASSSPREGQESGKALPLGHVTPFAETRSAIQQTQASLPESDSASIPSILFPHYGEVQVLEGLSLDEALQGPLDFKDSVTVAVQLRMLYLDLIKQVREEIPGLQNQVLPEDAANSLYESGILVLGWQDKKGALSGYVRCPPEYATRLAELHDATNQVLFSTAYLDGVLADAAASLEASHPGEVFSLVHRSDGTGVDIVGESGEVLASNHISVPGRPD